MATLKLEIVTPEEKIYSEDVEMVTLPGSQGELGVYPKHVPLLTTLKPGELRVVKNGRETAMAIGEGFVEMVTLPGSQGELGVYPKHVPLLTTLKPGELRVVKNGRETAMAIGEGFV